MSAATVARAPIGNILLAIEQRLYTRNVVPSRSVKWVTPGMTVPTFDSNFDCLLILGGLAAPLDPGAGRAWRIFTRRIMIQPRARLLLDQPDRVKTWLLGTSMGQGYLPLEEVIADALDLFMPLDGSNNQLCVCPLHLAASADPQKENRKKESAGWGYGSVTFECKYAFNATQGFS
jgi:hypothetical protein